MNRYDTVQGSKIHVVYDGRTQDLAFEDVFPQDRYASIGIPEGTEVTSQSVTQQQVKTALAQHFDVGITEFDDHFVEINPNGNITVRPNTTFG